VSRRLRSIPALLLLVACVDTSAPNREGDDRPDEGDPRDAWGGADLPVPGCVPDDDGVLGLDELPVDLGAGVSAAFLVNPAGSTRSVALDGWRFDGLRGDDETLRVAPSEVAGAWFAPEFPGAHHRALFDRSEEIFGVHALDDGLHLLGLASAARDVTALVYTPPVPLLPLPLADGDAWSVEVSAEGVADGVEYPVDWGLASVLTLHHTWTFAVDGVDTLALPALSIPAHRVRVEVVAEARNAVGLTIESESRRIVMWVAECLGVVARARSLPDEPAEDFTQATELLRLALPEPGS